MRRWSPDSGLRGGAAAVTTQSYAMPDRMPGTVQADRASGRSLLGDHCDARHTAAGTRDGGRPALHFRGCLAARGGGGRDRLRDRRPDATRSGNREPPRVRMPARPLGGLPRAARRRGAVARRPVCDGFAVASPRRRSCRSCRRVGSRRVPSLERGRARSRHRRRTRGDRLPHRRPCVHMAGASGAGLAPRSTRGRHRRGGRHVCAHAGSSGADDHACGRRSVRVPGAPAPRRRVDRPRSAPRGGHALRSQRVDARRDVRRDPASDRACGLRRGRGPRRRRPRTPHADRSRRESCGEMVAAASVSRPRRHVPRQPV